MNSIPTRSQLEAALQSLDPKDPVAGKLRAALQTYVAELSLQAERAGDRPDLLLLSAPRDEIEAFALELFTQYLAQSGIRISIKAAAPL
jgi:hypothetical protein